MNPFLKLIFLFGLMFCIKSHLNAQQSITWEKLYGYPNSDEGAYDVCESTDGNFFVVGYSGNSFVNGRMYVLKLNPFGDTLWTRKYNAGHYAYAVVPTEDDGCVMTGYGMDSLYAMKIDRDGNIIWQKFYAGGICLDMIKTSDGGYMACGYKGFGGYIMKIDSLGNMKWDTTLTASIHMFLYSISTGVNSNQDYVCAGTVREGNGITGIIFNVDLSGKIHWTKRINILNRVTNLKTIKTTENFYTISGSIPNDSNYQTFFSKLDSMGNVYFTNIFPSNERDEYNQGMSILSNSKYIFISDSFSNLIGDTLSSIIRISDSSGSIIYDRVFYSHGYLSINNILPLKNNDIIFCGINKLVSGSNDDYAYIIRTDSTLYSKPVKIHQISSAIPDEFNLFQNYPNPFNPTTVISYSLNENRFVSLKVYDILGKEVASLVNKNQIAGRYSVEFNAGSLASGIYIYKIEAGSFIDTKRMVLIK